MYSDGSEMPNIVWSNHCSTEINAKYSVLVLRATQYYYSTEKCEC